MTHEHSFDRVLLGGGLACTICDAIAPNAEKVGHRDGCTCYWCYVRTRDNERDHLPPNDSSGAP